MYIGYLVYKLILILKVYPINFLMNIQDTVEVHLILHYHRTIISEHENFAQIW